MLAAQQDWSGSSKCMSDGAIGNDGDEGQLTVVAGTSASTAERHDGGSSVW